jgi:hypothetical protein
MSTQKNRGNTYRESIAFFKNRGLLLLIATLLLFHIISYFYIREFYSQHLPHYDSIGSYTFMFEVINTYENGGFTVALEKASLFHLSWLQAFFALIAAPFLNKSPESMQLYNSICLFIFALSLFLAARAAGAGDLKSYLISLIVFLPDVFYDWRGGLMDMQRDPSFVSLLGATYFLFFAQAWKPSMKKATLLGVIAGLTVWSRGNAVFTLIATMAPICGTWALWRVLQKDSWAMIRNFSLSFIAFCLTAGPNLYHTCRATIARYRNPYVAYGLGDDSWSSLVAHWAKPFEIMFGREGTSGGGTSGTLYFTMGIIILVVLTLVFLGKLQYLRLNRLLLFNQRSLVLIVSGLWIITVTIILVCIVAKLKPLGFTSAKWPFYPSLLGFLSGFFVLGVATSRKSERILPSKEIYTLSVLLIVGILVLGIARIDKKTPYATPEYVDLANELATFFSSSYEPKVIAFIWHDLISIDTLKFYLSQKGSQPPQKFYFTAPDGSMLDFAVTVPVGVDITELLITMKEQIEEKSDFLVITAEPGAYSRANDHRFVFRHGQYVIDSFLNNYRFKPVLEYNLMNMTFVVLQNMSRGKSKIKDIMFSSQT